MAFLQPNIDLPLFQRSLPFLRWNDLSVFFSLGKVSLLNRIFYLCSFLLLFSSAVFAQHSNVQVTNTATSGGSWSALTSGTYTFTPTSDNANINVSDIQNRLLGGGFTRGNVTIVTTNGTGTQVGNVNIATAITASNVTSTGYTFTVDASGDINVSSAINLAASTVVNTSNRASMSVVLTALGSISITSPITTNAYTNNNASGIGPAGSISLTATGNVYTSSVGTLNAIGGYSSWSGEGRGGDVSIDGASVSLGGSISNGGVYSNNSTTTGNIAISTTNTATTAGVNDGQVSGVITGGNFVKSGAGIFVLKGSNTYTGTTTISAGTLQLGATNSIPTTSGLVLAGGEFQSGGFSNTFASIALSANSILRLGSGVHTLTFTNLGSFTSGTMLTIEGWQGTYANPGATGTAGKIVFNPTTSATILGQLKFKNSGTGNLHTSIRLGTKEIVAGNQ